MGQIRSTNGGLFAAMLAQAAQAPCRMTAWEAWKFIEPTRVALQRLLDGAGSREDVATVGVAFNMAWLRAQDVDKLEDQAWFDMAGLVLGDLDAQEPPRAPSPAEHEALCVAINRYDALLRACSFEGWVKLMERLLAIAGEKAPA